MQMADESAAKARPPALGAARHREEAGVEFSRIVAFSDGVFAIAITLLVLALDVPEHANDLTRVLENQEGDLFAYALSFAVLGRWWLGHHRFFGSLERFDGPLMGLNLFYLAWIALVPFSSEVLGDYGDETAGVVLYAANMAGVALAFSAQIVYADRRGLMKPELRLALAALLGLGLGGERGRRCGAALVIERHQCQVRGAGVALLAADGVLGLDPHPDLHRGPPHGVDTGAAGK